MKHVKSHRDQKFHRWARCGLGEDCVSGELCMLGSITRTEAWNNLEKRDRIKSEYRLAEQTHDNKPSLVLKLTDLSLKTSHEEKEMYPDFKQAMQACSFFSARYKVFVVDTHGLKDVGADITFAEFDDERLKYCILYLLELKLKGKRDKLDTADHCGQVLDYCHMARRSQPDRKTFIRILSNLEITWLFTIQYEGDDVSVDKRLAPSLADAIIHTDIESWKHYKRIPALNTRFPQNFSILAPGNHTFILKVEKLASESAVITPPSNVGTRTRSKVSGQKDPRHSPSRHVTGETFALKIVGLDVDITAVTGLRKEINMLRKIREADCVHIPELVWDPDGGKEFGIVPVGRRIDFRQVSAMSKQIVSGLLEGLEWLHKKGIIHRDIRPLNLVLDDKGNMVIIDYETAVPLEEGEVEYEGGYMCWSRRLLEWPGQRSHCGNY
jgi:serine/threonine protein kinase